MPRNVFDQAARFGAKLDPPAFLAWALGLPAVEVGFADWLDTRRLPFPGEADRTGDTVARLDGPGGEPWAVAVEFQTEPDPAMFGRLLGYLADLWQTVRPDPERGSRFAVGAVVVNLTGAGSASREMRWPAAGLATHLGVVERNLAREDADELLRRIEAGDAGRALLPWLPLMTGGDDSGIIDRWKLAAETEPDARRRAEYAGLVLVFADAADRKPAWQQALKGWNVRQSSVVLEWQAEAWAEALLDSLGTKHGALPADLIVSVQSATDLERLRAWNRLVITTATLDEFRTRAGI